MSNYEANPVGFLYERYQSSGVSPLYEVVMTRGQAHAPIFTAKLTVPQGHTVSATGSSKKIAKNLAAKLMLDKLEEVEGQSRLVQNSKNRVINVNTNYVTSPAALDTYPAVLDADCPANLGTLGTLGTPGTVGTLDTPGTLGTPGTVGNQDTVAMPPTHLGVEATQEVPEQEVQGELLGEVEGVARGNSVLEFYRGLRARGGAELEGLQARELVVSGWELDSCALLARVGREQGFGLSYREVTGQHGESEPGLGMVQVSGEGSDTICLGEGSDPGQARQAAARTALIYLQTMTRREEEVAMSPNQELE